MKECSICKKYTREIANMEAGLKEISAEREPKRIELMSFQMKMSATKYALELHRNSGKCTEGQEGS